MGSGASQSTQQKGKYLTKLLQDSYQQDKGYLGDVAHDCKGQKPVLSRSSMWSYRKAKYVSGTQFNNR
jgi:hypothetical protein